MNVTALLSASGQPLERYVYSPYGGATLFDRLWASSHSAPLFGNAVLYTGREWDVETGMYCYSRPLLQRGLGSSLAKIRSRTKPTILTCIATSGMIQPTGLIRAAS